MKTKVFRSGNSLAIRLPKELELPCGVVSIRRDGKRILIEEMSSTGWPEGFFEDILVTRNDFGREAVLYEEKSLSGFCSIPTSASTSYAVARKS